MTIYPPQTPALFALQRGAAATKLLTRTGSEELWFHVTRSLYCGVLWFRYHVINGSPSKIDDADFFFKRVPTRLKTNNYGAAENASKISF